MCRSWPGVVIPQEEAATEKQSVASASGNPVITSLEDQIGNCIRLVGTKCQNLDCMLGSCLVWCLF